MSKRLKALLARFCDAVHGGENLRRQALMNATNQFKQKEAIPVYFCVPFDWSIMRVNLWKKLLKTELDIPAVLAAVGEYPETLAEQVIEFQLRQRIFYIEEMPGDMPVKPEITTNFNLLWLEDRNRANPLWGAVPYDLDSGDFHLEPKIKTPEDFEQLTVEPFRFDPALHARRVAMFEELTDGQVAIQDDLEGHGYLNRFGSPFQELCRLRGMIDLLMDLREEPEWVHLMLLRLTQAGIERCNEMNRKIGREIFFPAIGGDEINCQMFSAEDYDEFIFPYEKCCAERGKNYYYHSCGNLTQIFDRISQLPNIQKIHVSPWSDLATAAAMVGKRAVLQRIADTQREIRQADDESMVRMFNGIRKFVGECAIEVGCHCETFEDYESSCHFVKTGQRLCAL